MSNRPIKANEGWRQSRSARRCSAGRQTLPNRALDGARGDMPAFCGAGWAPGAASLHLAGPLVLTAVGVVTANALLVRC